MENEEGTSAKAGMAPSGKAVHSGLTMIVSSWARSQRNPSTSLQSLS